MSYRFDFALSFAGSHRVLAEEIRTRLRSKGLKVFYDRDFEHEMVGRDGALYLRDIYSWKSRHCLVLISDQYEQREWAQLERESIQSRELRGERGVLIPVLVDCQVPSWLPETRIYFDLRARSLEDLIDLLVRLHETEQDPPDRAETARVSVVYDALKARGQDFVAHCLSHLTLALTDGFLRLALGYSSTKTDAGEALIKLGALEASDVDPRCQITSLGIELLHMLRERNL